MRNIRTLFALLLCILVVRGEEADDCADRIRGLEMQLQETRDSHNQATQSNQQCEQHKAELNSRLEETRGSLDSTRASLEETRGALESARVQLTQVETKAQEAAKLSQTAFAEVLAEAKTSAQRVNELEVELKQANDTIHKLSLSIWNHIQSELQSWVARVRAVYSKVIQNFVVKNATERASATKTS